MSLMSQRAGAHAVLLAGVIGLVIIVWALILEHGFGYAPCPLCLKQRWPYYIGVPIALLLGVFGTKLPPRLLALLLAALAALFVYGSALGVYQAGAEWEFWLGPSDCAAGNSGANPADVGNLLAAIDKSIVVSCTTPSLRIFGLSLAGGNAIVMAVMVILTLFGAWKSAKAA